MVTSKDFEKLWYRYQDEVQATGKSIVAYCQENGIVYSQFERWYKKRRVSKIVRYEYGKYLLYVIALERDLKFMKVVHRNPIVNEDGTGVHYEIKWNQLVALFSCPVRSVIRI